MCVCVCGVLVSCLGVEWVGPLGKEFKERKVKKVCLSFFLYIYIYIDGYIYGVLVSCLGVEWVGPLGKEFKERKVKKVCIYIYIYIWCVGELFGSRMGRATGERI